MSVFIKPQNPCSNSIAINPSIKYHKTENSECEMTTFLQNLLSVPNIVLLLSEENSNKNNNNFNNGADISEGKVIRQLFPGSR